MGRARFEWTDEMRELLRVAWHDKTLSIVDMARQVGIGRDACRNEAARLGLPPREEFRSQSAIRRARSRSSEPRAQPVRPGQRTLPLLPSEEAALGQ